MSTTYPYCRLITNGKFVIYYRSISTTITLKSKEVKSIAKLTFSDWIKYLTANKPQQDNMKKHTLYYNGKARCVNCTNKLSKDEKEQSTLCSDCINELDFVKVNSKLGYYPSLTKKRNISLDDVKEEPNSTVSSSTGKPRLHIPISPVFCNTCECLISIKEYNGNNGKCNNCLLNS